MMVRKWGGRLSHATGRGTSRAARCVAYSPPHAFPDRTLFVAGTCRRPTGNRRADRRCQCRLPARQLCRRREDPAADRRRRQRLRPVPARAGLSEATGEMRSPEEAAKWFESAALQGQPHAQYKLGILYVNGNGVSKDFVAGLHVAQPQHPPHRRQRLRSRPAARPDRGADVVLADRRREEAGAELAADEVRDGNATAAALEGAG